MDFDVISKLFDTVSMKDIQWHVILAIMSGRAIQLLKKWGDDPSNKLPNLFADSRVASFLSIVFAAAAVLWTHFIMQHSPDGKSLMFGFTIPTMNLDEFARGLVAQFYVNKAYYFTALKGGDKSFIRAGFNAIKSKMELSGLQSDHMNRSIQEVRDARRASEIILPTSKVE